MPHILRGQERDTQEDGSRDNGDGDDPVAPTRGAIARLCEETQAGWSPAQRRRATATTQLPSLPLIAKVQRERVEAEE